MSLQRVIARFAVAFLIVGAAFGATAATPTSVCACTTKEKAYISSMRADLRNLVTAQESFLADSGRFGTAQEIVVPERFVFSSGVELVSLSSRADGYEARFGYPIGTTRQCWISVGTSPDALADPNNAKPQCTPTPMDTAHLRWAISYAVLLLIAVAIRFARAGTGLPAVSIGTIAGFLFLAVAHPFWQPIREQVGCTIGGNFDILSVIAVAVITVWMAIRTHKSPVPPVPA